MRVAAYVYPGWHPIPERDDYSHIPGFWLRALKQIHVRFDRA